MNKEDLFNTKVKIKDEEEYEKVTDKLLRLGFIDSYGEDVWAKYIFIYGSGVGDANFTGIDDDDFRYFDQHKHREIKVSDIGKFSWREMFENE